MLRRLTLLSLLLTQHDFALAAPKERVLLYAYVGENGFRHDSIPDAVAAIQALGKQHGFDCDVNDDNPAAFEDRNYLNRYDALGLISVGGRIWTNERQANNVYRWLIDRSGPVFGVHAATTADAPGNWYQTLMGAGFSGHQADQQDAKFLKIKSEPHVSTDMLPDEYRTGYREEVYNFDRDPRATGNVVLMSVDDKSYYGQPEGADLYQGDPHPITWLRYGVDLPGPGVNGSSWADGRFWYTSIGHSREIYADKLYRQHLLMGITWTLGRPDDWRESSSTAAAADVSASLALPIATASVKIDPLQILLANTTGALQVESPASRWSLPSSLAVLSPLLLGTLLL